MAEVVKLSNTIYIYVCMDTHMYTYATIFTGLGYIVHERTIHKAACLAATMWQSRSTYLPSAFPFGGCFC